MYTAALIRLVSGCWVAGCEVGCRARVHSHWCSGTSSEEHCPHRPAEPCEDNWWFLYKSLTHLAVFPFKFISVEKSHVKKLALLVNKQRFLSTNKFLRIQEKKHRTTTTPSYRHMTFAGCSTPWLVSTVGIDLCYSTCIITCSNPWISITVILIITCKHAYWKKLDRPMLWFPKGFKLQKLLAKQQQQHSPFSPETSSFCTSVWVLL